MLINASGLSTEPVQRLIPGLYIPRTGTGIMHGPPLVGKSLICLEAALAIGNPSHQFLGMDVVHGNVIYVLGEGHHDAGVRVKARVDRQVEDDHAAWLAAVAAAGPGGKPLPSYAPYTDKRLMVETEPFPCLIDKWGPVPKLAGAIGKFSAIPQLELVVLDGATNFVGPGGSLSSVSTASKLVEGMKYMASQLNCFVLLVNNDNTDGSKMKGAGELADGVDMVMPVTAGWSSEMDTRTNTLSCRKNKSGPLFPPVSYVVEESPGGLSATVRLAEEMTETLVIPEPVLAQPPKRNGLLRYLASQVAKA